MTALNEVSIPELAPIETAAGWRCPYCGQFFAAKVGVRAVHIGIHVAGCVPLTMEQAEAVLDWAASAGKR
ncbi:hypothetical protein HC024_00210 [Methylococcaceae bacterium WWC4]|nr:hypothetical protein [Methylococcaceae bacterium WWC4]